VIPAFGKEGDYMASRAIYRPSKTDRVFDVANIVIILIFTLIVLYPIIFVVMASVSNPAQIFDTPLLLWPRGFSLDGYKEILQNKDILVGFKNAIIYTFLGTLVNLIVTTLGAYPLSRKEFVGKGFFTIFFTITMFFSGGLIPTYLVNQQLGIINTIWVMILPGAVSVYNMILMRTYFQQNIPSELLESAYVDGANDLQLLWKVVLPLSTPIIAVMAMFYGVGRWNDYFNAMIYLQDRSKFPLQLILREILVQGQFGDTSKALINSANAQTMLMKLTLKYSVVVVSTLPVLLFYPVVAKYFEKGIMVGAIKG
jgi:putative aldouronate transport system permease protein